MSSCWCQMSSCLLSHPQRVILTIRLESRAFLRVDRFELAIRTCCTSKMITLRHWYDTYIYISSNYCTELTYVPLLFTVVT